MPEASQNGIVNLPTRHSVDTAVAKIEEILQSKNIRLFSLIDHSGEAEKARLQKRPTKLLIFGNPKSGTPLMLAAPFIAIDLPLKILVWQDAAGQVWISYNSPEYLRSRHGFPPELLTNIAALEAIAAKAAE